MIKKIALILLFVCFSFGEKNIDLIDKKDKAEVKKIEQNIIKEKEEEALKIEEEKRIRREEIANKAIENAKKQGYKLKKQIQEDNTIRLVLQKRTY